MFGSLTGPTSTADTDWGERLLNAAVSQSIRSLFTRSESVEVRIRCYPSSKLLQGSIDSFKMDGKGLLIRRDFLVEDMSFETDAVSIDFSSVLGGKVRLKQPTQAIAQVTLSEDGINEAFKSPLVTQRLNNLNAPELTALADGKPVSFPEVHVRLLSGNDLLVEAKADLGDKGIVPIAMKVTLGIERRRRISFTNPRYEASGIPQEQQELSKSLTHILANILDGMVDLDRFDLDGVILRLNRLETKGKLLLFSGYAQIQHFPRNP